MTEKFHHINDAVHPEITRYGFDKVPICPCINVSVGPVASNWASDSMYLGREELDVEFIGGTYTVDHFVKGVCLWLLCLVLMFLWACSKLVLSRLSFVWATGLV